MRAVERVSARAVERQAAALAEALGAVAGVSVEREGGDVVLTGRGLRVRAVTERALRDPGAAFR